MRTAFLSLLSLFSFTVICPITMGAMPMNMDNTATVSHAMQSDDTDKSSMPCDQCEKDRVEVIASINSQTEVIAPAAAKIVTLPFWELAGSPNALTYQTKELSANGPPLPIDTLIGTVVLRT